MFSLALLQQRNIVGLFQIASIVETLSRMSPISDFFKEKAIPIQDKSSTICSQNLDPFVVIKNGPERSKNRHSLGHVALDLVTFCVTFCLALDIKQALH